MFKIKDKVKAINRDMVIENINIGSGRAYGEPEGLQPKETVLKNFFPDETGTITDIVDLYDGFTVVDYIYTVYFPKAKKSLGIGADNLVHV